MFLILAAVVVVCGHVYGGNSSDVYFDEPIFLNNITELGNKSYTLQPLTFAPSTGNLVMLSLHIILLLHLFSS